MGNNRSKVPDLEKLVKGGRKKFVRYEEGAMLYSMGVHTFQQLAKDARAVYHVKRIVLVNLDLDFPEIAAARLWRHGALVSRSCREGIT